MTMPATELRITNDRRGGHSVVSARGRIDHATATGLGWVLSRAVSAESVTLDLGEAQITDESGTVLLLNAMRRLHSRQRELVVVSPPPMLQQALDRTGLARRVALLREADVPREPQSDPAPAHDVGDDAAPIGIAGSRGPRTTTARRRAALLADATLAIDRRHAECGLSLNDIAREIATSDRQLQRVFAEIGGSTFRDELAAVRMQHGADLLQTTGLLVSDIARRVGYRHSAQFSAAFRHHHGLSPSRFRRASASGTRTRVRASAWPSERAKRPLNIDPVAGMG